MAYPVLLDVYLNLKSSGERSFRVAGEVLVEPQDGKGLSLILRCDGSKTHSVAMSYGVVFESITGKHIYCEVELSDHDNPDIMGSGENIMTAEQLVEACQRAFLSAGFTVQDKYDKP